MPGPLVTISDNGFGIPVRSVDGGHPVLTLSSNGRGVPIILSDRGAPFVVEGTPTEPTEPTEPVPDVLGFGFDPDVDEGVEGDIFVSPSGNDTSGDGTVASPYSTISKAVSSLSSTKRVIRLREGVYRESVSLTSKTIGSVEAPVILARYGNERAEVTGFEPISGWTSCTSDDATVVGENWSSIYKATVPLSNFPGSSPVAGNLHEGSKRMPIAAAKQPYPFQPTTDAYVLDWLVSDETIVDGSNLILGYRAERITSRYTAAQLMLATIQYHVSPNTERSSAISGVVDGVITLADQTRTYETNTKKDRFMVTNLAAALSPGQWAYVVDGANVTLYVWPENPDSIAVNIKMSRRDKGIDLRGSSHVQIRGLIVSGFAGAGAPTDMNYSITAGNTVGTTFYENLQIVNCLIEESWRTIEGYAAITLRNVNNWKIERCTIKNAIGQFGIFCLGSNPNTPGSIQADRGHMHRCAFVGTDKAPFRIYSSRRIMVTECDFRAGGFSAHSNKGNFYEGCDTCLVYRCNWTAMGGYFAMQEASGIHFGMNWIPAGAADGSRAFVDQNHASGFSPATLAGVDQISHLFNNALPPYSTGISSVNSMTLGYAADPNSKFSVRNNILHGAVPIADYIVDWKNNVYTSGTPHDATDSAAAYGSVYEDLSIGDMTIKAGSPTKSAAASSLSTVISELQATFPDYDGFTFDLAGNSFDPASAFVGPYSPSSAQLATSPIWVERPEIVGAPAVGSTLSISGGYVLGFPYPAVTRQWVVSSDDWVTYSPISGATGNTYTIDSSIEGKHVGLVSTAGGVSVVTPILLKVAGSYPIGTPTVIKEVSQTGNLSSYTIPSVSFTGAPALLVVHTRNGSAADNALTISTPAGVFVATAAKARRGVVESQAYLCAAPSPGTYDISISGSVTSNSSIMHVVEVAGLSSVGVIGTAGSTSNLGWSPSFTSTQAQSVILFLVNRMDGSLSNPITLGNVEAEVFNKNTSDAVTGQITVASGYKAAPTIGAYSASVSWLTAAQSFWLAVELKGE